MGRLIWKELSRKWFNLSVVIAFICVGSAYFMSVELQRMAYQEHIFPVMFCVTLGISRKKLSVTIFEDHHDLLGPKLQVMMIFLILLRAQLAPPVCVDSFSSAQ